MGLETSTFLSGLTSSWPLPSDRKSVGDDHLRLVKAVLQNTFPNATKAFRFPSVDSSAGNFSVLASHQNATIFLNTSPGEFTATLPMLSTTDAGWFCDFIKTSTDVNGVTIAPPSGLILSKVGSTATVRVGILAEPVRLFWHGAAWFCFKFGTMIGVTENFDGTGPGPFGEPAGYLIANGAAFNTSLYAELYAALSAGTLQDKRGRVEAGIDHGANRLTGAFFGGGGIGATGGFEGIGLTAAQLAAHTHANAIDNPTHTHSTNTTGIVSIQNGTGTAQGNVVVSTGGTPVLLPTNAAAPGLTLTNVAAGGDAAHNNVQPTVMVRKIIRAC